MNVKYMRGIKRSKMFHSIKKYLDRFFQDADYRISKGRKMKQFLVKDKVISQDRSNWFMRRELFIEKK